MTDSPNTEHRDSTATDREEESGSTLNLNPDEGMGQFDETSEGGDDGGNNIPITGADSGWEAEDGGESTESPDESQGRTPDDVTVSDPPEEGATQTGPHTTVAALNLSDIGPAVTLSEAVEKTDEDIELHVPGTDYSNLPLLFQRTGKKATSFDRPGERRFNTFEETETLLKLARDQLNDEYEENVLKADLSEALLLVGLSHLDDTKAVLEAWGYGATQ